MKAFILPLAIGALALVVGCRGWETTEPPIHLNWNMDTQEKGKAYRTAALFKDGRMMQAPPAGTVARGFEHADDVLHLGVDAAGEPTKAFPGGYTSWEPKLARGKRQYGIYCGPCHGLALDGKGPVSFKLTVPPPSLMEPRIKKLPIGRVYQAMTNGVNAGNMGSYSAQLSEDDRWAVAYYVRDFQRASDPKIEWEGGEILVVKPAEVASIEHGALLYEAKGCNACHTTDGTAKVGPTFKGVFGKSENTDKGAVTVDAAYITESILKPNEKVVVGFPPAMPPQVGLTEIDLQSLSMFIESLK